MTNKSGRNFCDELWAKIVKTRDGYKCAICDNEKMPNAHHLISRKVFKYRWDTSNGITLCPNHHEFDVSFSAHTAPWALEYWLKDHREVQYAKHVEARNNIDNVKTDYQEIYWRLEEEYKELTGENYKFSRLNQYMMFKYAQKIDEMYADGETFKEIAEQLNVSPNAMKKFMIDNKIIVKEVKPKSS